MKPELKPGTVYTGTVAELQIAADSFNKTTGSGGMVWCHYLLLKVMGFESCDEVVGQICTESPRFTDFEANDDIKFSVTKETKGRWSIQFKAVAKKALQKGPLLPNEKEEDLFDEDRSFPKNIAGTIVDRAGYLAVQHFMYRAEDVKTDEKFFKFWKDCIEFMKKNINQ